MSLHNMYRGPDSILCISVCKLYTVGIILVIEESTGCMGQLFIPFTAIQTPIPLVYSSQGNNLPRFQMPESSYSLVSEAVGGTGMSLPRLRIAARAEACSCVSKTS
jgi:hypothetical protein